MRDERAGDIEDAIALLRKHAKAKNHVILEIHLRFGRPVGVVKETRTTLVSELKDKRLKQSKPSDSPNSAASDTNPSQE